MQHRYSRYLRLFYIVIDLVLLNAAYIVAFLGDTRSIEDLFYYPLAGFLFFINASWLGLIFLFKLYTDSRIARITQILRNYFNLIILHLLLVTAFLVFNKIHFFSREHIFNYYLFFTFSVVAYRLVTDIALRNYRKKGYNARNIVIIGYGDLGKELKRIFDKNPHLGYKFLGFFDDHYSEINPTIGKLNDLQDFVFNNDIDEIYCTLSDVKYDQVSKLMEFADRNLINMHILPDFRSFSYKRVMLNFVDFHPVMSFINEPIDTSIDLYLKRAFDIVFSFTFMLVLSPLYLLVAILTKLSSKGPVFFVQDRIGRKGDPFKIYKFRSMRIDAEESGPLLSKDDDPRITPWGKFMRKTRVDELPQFYNVLIGNMSTVGPRPERQFFIDQIVGQAPHYKRLHRVKPGITSLGQVKFGYAENVGQMLQRLRYDLLYVENYSFVLDLKVMFMTLSVMFQGKGK